MNATPCAGGSAEPLNGPVDKTSPLTEGVAAFDGAADGDSDMACEGAAADTERDADTL